MLKFVLDLLFPKRCVGCRKFGSYLCSSCFSFISFDVVTICPVCNKNSIDGATHPRCETPYSLDGLVAGVVYRGIIKKLVYKFKYEPHLSDLKKIIAKLFFESLSQNEVFYNLLKSEPFIVVVPLYKTRERKRGYNHAAIIGQYVAQSFKLDFLDKVLMRIKDTKPQFKLKKEERQKNIKGAFCLNKKFKDKIMDKNILIIDDLATTCATLNECAKVLKRNGAKFVWGVVFSREN